MGDINNILTSSSDAVVFDIAIIGGGPAGMMAAISAHLANPGSRICILEKNNSLGKKLLLTGNGRCNYTTSLDLESLINSFGKRGRFLFEAFNSFNNKDLIEFFKSKGIMPQYEDDFKVFPKDGNSQAVLSCLLNELTKRGITIRYNYEVTAISEVLGSTVFGMTAKSGDANEDNQYFKTDSDLKISIFSKKIIICAGGLSYPQTGSSGGGYELSKKLGHDIIDLSPSIVALLSDYLTSLNLKGISLKNAGLSIMSRDKTQGSKNGALIFTHFGISGPSAMNLGNTVFMLAKRGEEVFGVIDFCPDISLENILSKYEEVRPLTSKKEIISSVKIILPEIPGDLILKLFEITGIDPHQKTGNIKKAEILKLLALIKKFTFKIDGTLPISAAIVTEGGIPLKEIDPKTMRSRINENLYFAGEIIEMQGPEGGFNLQKAFSTGWLAGKSASLDN